MPKIKKTAEYKEELSLFRKLAKRADQRLRQLEKDAHRSGFENLLSWAYRKAMKDIRYWSGEGKTTFNRDAPRNLNQLRAKRKDIEEFLNAPTSMISTTKEMFEQRADTLNDKYGTNFTWEELGNVFENKEENEFYQKGGVSYLQAVSYMKENEESLLQSLQDGSRAIIKTGNRKANQIARELINEYGLEFNQLY